MQEAQGGGRDCDDRGERGAAGRAACPAESREHLLISAAHDEVDQLLVRPGPTSQRSFTQEPTAGLPGLPPSVVFPKPERLEPVAW